MKDAGTLRYSPKLLGDRKSSKWWLILDCDEELGRYYRWLHHTWSHRCDKLMRPAWDAHITVVRDEEPLEDRKHLWERYSGELVEFTLNPYVGTNGDYFWLDVFCPRLLDIREELGLPRDPLYPLHLSIGHRGTS